MMRAAVLVLALLNLGVLLWGWAQDGPEIPPPLAPTSLEIRLLSEAPVPIAAPAPDRTAPAAAVQAAPAATRLPASAPVSAFDGGAVRPPQRMPLPQTHVERADPGLLPEEMEAEPPIVIPPVREDPPGPAHRWLRDRMQGEGRGVRD